MLTIIAAVAGNGVIGQGNRLPWRLPEDLKHFKALTMGHPMIMGRKTWESLPGRLPGRPHIVVTRNPDYRAEGATVAASLPAAIEAARRMEGGGEAFVIGGAELYAQALPLADRLLLTEIAADFEGDARFPDFDRGEWRETARERRRAESGLDFEFAAYERATVGLAMRKFGFRIRTASGLSVDGLMIQGRDEQEAERKLRQMYPHCTVVECSRPQEVPRSSAASLEDVLNLITK